MYQHDADEEISKTHVHIALVDCETKSEALKRMWKDAPGKGNEFWSWKDIVGDSEGEDKQNLTRYITYMSKGILREKYSKNFSQEELEKFRQLWVEPVKADKSGDDSDRLINSLVTKVKDMYNTFRLTNRHGEDRSDILCYDVDTVLNFVRKETFKALYYKKRMFPHASHYKIIAGSVFMRICENDGYLDEGINKISELWL